MSFTFLSCSNIQTLELGNNLLGDRAAKAFGEALARNNHIEGKFHAWPAPPLSTPPPFP